MGRLEELGPQSVPQLLQGLSPHLATHRHELERSPKPAVNTKNDFVKRFRQYDYRSAVRVIMAAVSGFKCYPFPSGGQAATCQERSLRRTTPRNDTSLNLRQTSALSFLKAAPSLPQHPGTRINNSHTKIASTIVCFGATRTRENVAVWSAQRSMFRGFVIH